MRIGVIQASSQSEKNSLLFETVKTYAKYATVLNFGCTPEEKEKYSYIEISILAGLLLASGSLDLVVTGCSSGQGMMLACNNVPGVLCGYVPTPMDAYLFAQINDGNAVSVPLGEEYTWQGKENLEKGGADVIAYCEKLKMEYCKRVNGLQKAGKKTDIEERLIADISNYIDKNRLS